MTGIFADTAPLYWAAGLSAIPLHRNDKIPVPARWQRFSSEPVSGFQQQDWVQQYPQNNVGLVLGEQSDLVMIDIDTDDVIVNSVIKKLLPPSPWERRGMKGVVLAYRFSGEKTFRIKTADGKMLVECLSSRTQVVLPPSIHPDTRLPYQASCDLFDPAVLATLLPLPPDFETILRTSLEHAGVVLSLSGHTRVTDYISKGARDVQMIAVAGHYANGIVRGELSFKEALERMVAWHATCVEKVSNSSDDIDIEKGVIRLAEFLIRDVTGPKQRALPEGWDKALTDDERKGFGFEIFTEKNESWSYDRLKEFIRQAFIEHEPDSVGRRTSVEDLLVKIAKSEIGQIDEERLIRYVVAASGLGVSVTVLKKRLLELRSGGLAGADHNEIAEAVLEEMGAVGQVASEGSFFWQWKGSNWEKVDEGIILKLIAENYGHLPLAKRQSDHRGVLKVMEVKARRDLKQTDEPGVNFANGFVGMDLVLRDHHPDFGCTYTLPYRYVAELGGSARKFQSFLASCWGNDIDFHDKKAALQEALAATLFGQAPTLERAFCLHGPPKSGKSQMLKIIASMLPAEVVCAIPPTAWADRFLPAELHGKLLNICGELSERKFIDGEQFKQVVSGEQMTAQQKNKNPFRFRPMCAHWFATNHIPRTKDTSSGFSRRWLMLVYDHSVGEEEKVLDLGTLIAAEEREAIAAWAIQKIPELLSRREYTLPLSHRQRIEEIARANNSLRAFILDPTKVLLSSLRLVGESSSVNISELDIYNAYYTFALVAGDAKPVSLSMFRHQMRELGSEMGFRAKVTEQENGLQHCVYENITLAKGSMVSARKRTGTE